MTKEILDVFGKRLMSEYAKRLYGHLSDLANGKYAEHSWYDAKYSALLRLDESQRRAVQSLIDETVISSMHAFLEIFERDMLSANKAEGALFLMMADSSGQLVNLAETSDGLAGELYSEVGWVDRFGFK